jgi:hypothetical protein
MYLNPFDSAHSGQINASDGQATILGLNFGGRCELRIFFIFKHSRGHLLASGNTTKLVKKLMLTSVNIVALLSC